MVYMNLAIIEGNITKDAQTRAVGEGSCVTTFTLANNEGFGGSAGESRTNFLQVEFWGEDFANKMAPHLKKGVALRVFGRIRTDFWVSDDGTRREKVFIKGNSANFLGFAPKPQTNSPIGNKGSGYAADEDAITDDGLEIQEGDLLADEILELPEKANRAVKAKKKGK